MHADYTSEAIGKPNLDIRFVDEHTAGVVSDPVSTLGFNAQLYELEYHVGPETREGRMCSKCNLAMSYGTCLTPL